MQAVADAGFLNGGGHTGTGQVPEGEGDTPGEGAFPFQMGGVSPSSVGTGMGSGDWSGQCPSPEIVKTF